GGVRHALPGRATQWVAIGQRRPRYGDLPRSARVVAARRPKRRSADHDQAVDDGGSLPAGRLSTGLPAARRRGGAVAARARRSHRGRDRDLIRHGCARRADRPASRVRVGVVGAATEDTVVLDDGPPQVRPGGTPHYAARALRFAGAEPRTVETAGMRSLIEHGPGGT